ncbi:MAG: rod shape-determining protein [bacterium]
MFIKKIGIDLGTANTLVHVPKKGIVINEPSVVAITQNNQILAVGSEAKEMLGRTPETITAYKPLKDGVIADYKATEAMLKYFIDKVTKPIRLFRPEVMVGVPAGITSTERRAVIEACVQAGAKATYLLKEPVAAAIGAGIPITSASGNMIVDIGGGTSEVAVISLGGIVSCASARVGGNKIDQAIADYIRKKHGLAIGERMAEQIKIAVGNALPQDADKEKILEIRGSDLVEGLPKIIGISSNEITEAIQEQLREIIQAIKTVLRDTPPELAADVIEKGIVLSGGGGLLRNLDQLITQSIGINCYLTEEPLFDVVKGVGIVLENLDAYKQSLLAAK